MAVAWARTLCSKGHLVPHYQAVRLYCDVVRPLLPRKVKAGGNTVSEWDCFTPTDLL